MFIWVIRFLLYTILALPINSMAQPLISADKIEKTISLPSDSVHALWRTHEALQKIDSIQRFKLLEDAKIDANQNEIKWARWQWLYARSLVMANKAQFSVIVDKIGKQVLPLLKDEQAKYLAVEWNVLLGSVNRYLNRGEESLYYLANAKILMRELRPSGFPYPLSIYGDLSLLLFELNDYRACAQVTNELLEEVDDSTLNSSLRMNLTNTVGVCYLRLNELDSSRQAFDRAFAYAVAQENSLWKGIINGNYGQVLFAGGYFDSARTLIEMDYVANKEWKEWSNVANALQWLARIDLVQGRLDAAQAKVREALTILSQYPRSDYLEYTLFVASELHRSRGRQDSAEHYLARYRQLHDALQNRLRPNLLALAYMGIEREAVTSRVLQLQQQQRSDKLLRNGLMALVILLCIGAIGIHLINVRRLEAERALAKKQQQYADAIMQTATEKLLLFTQSLMEKNEAILRLEQKLADLKPENTGGALKSLSETTLLTDADWEKFKTLFEQAFPGFMFRLKKAFPNMSPAELRMACLFKLQLGVKPMASVLGISTISVYKSRQRLRQRTGITSDGVSHRLTPSCLWQ